MSKHWTPRKKTVELEGDKPVAGSRIRREPPPAGKIGGLASKIDWSSREWETRLVVIGIIFFALAINAVVFDVGELFGH